MPSSRPHPASDSAGFLDPARWLRVVALTMMIGGLLTIGTVVMPHPDRSADVLIAGFGAMIGVSGLLLLHRSRHSRNATVEVQMAMLVSSLGLIGLCFSTMHTQGPVDGFMMFVPLMVSALIGPIRWVLGIYAVQVTGFGAALAFTTSSDGIDEFAQWISLVGGLLIIVLFQHRVRGLLLDATRRLEEAADTDVLTGTYNRRGASTRGTALLTGAPTGTGHLLLCDVDHFKSVNDRYGHAVGDEVLVAVADAIRHATRDSDDDLVFRLGGEEFGVLTRGLDAHAAMQLAERMRALVGAVRFEEFPELRVTISIGVATSVGAADSWDDLVARADAAMYSAKAGGRNRVVPAAAPLSVRAAEIAA